MNMRIVRLITVAAFALALAGCITYYPPRVADDGVYYDPPRTARTGVRVSAGAIDPVIYPYWSLDYFYFSRHYHPYSVRVHNYDPWFYPYPGWYYGYRRPAHSGLNIGLSYYYPWYSFGVHYRHHRPWYVKHHYQHHKPQRHHDRHRRGPGTRYRVRQIDQRLHALEQRRSAIAAGGQQSHRTTLPVSQRLPASSRRAAVTRPADRRAAERAGQTRRQQASERLRSPRRPVDVAGQRPDVHATDPRERQPRAGDRNGPIRIDPDIRVRVRDSRDEGSRERDRPRTRQAAPVQRLPERPQRRRESAPVRESSRTPNRQRAAPQRERNRESDNRRSSPQSRSRAAPSRSRQSAPTRSRSSSRDRDGGGNASRRSSRDRDRDRR